MNIKTEINKQEEQRQNHKYRECFDGYPMEEEFRGMGEEVRGLRSTNWWSQNSHGDVKYNIGNGIDKEFIHMAHAHEQWWGIA